MSLLHHSWRSLLLLAIRLLFPALGRSSGRSLERLLEVGNDIVNVLSAYRYANEVLYSLSASFQAPAPFETHLRHARTDSLLLGQLLMRGVPGMNSQGL